MLNSSKRLCGVVWKLWKPRRVYMHNHWLVTFLGICTWPYCTRFHYLIILVRNVTRQMIQAQQYGSSQLKCSPKITAPWQFPGKNLVVPWECFTWIKETCLWATVDHVLPILSCMASLQHQVNMTIQYNTIL